LVAPARIIACTPTAQGRFSDNHNHTTTRCAASLAYIICSPLAEAVNKTANTPSPQPTHTFAAMDQIKKVSPPLRTPPCPLYVVHPIPSATPHFTHVVPN
jgi:hypothetical protein